MKLFLLGMLTAYVVVVVLYTLLDDYRPCLHLWDFYGGELVLVPFAVVIGLAARPFVWLFYVFRCLFLPVDPHRFYAVCSQYGTTAHRLIGPVFLCHNTQARRIERWFFVRVKL